MQATWQQMTTRLTDDPARDRQAFSKRNPTWNTSILRMSLKKIGKRKMG